MFCLITQKKPVSYFGYMELFWKQKEFLSYFIPKSVKTGEKVQHRSRALHPRAVMSRAFFGLREIPSVIRREQIVKEDAVLNRTPVSGLSYRQQTNQRIICRNKYAPSINTYCIHHYASAITKVYHRLFWIWLWNDITLIHLTIIFELSHPKFPKGSRMSIPMGYPFINLPPTHTAVEISNPTHHTCAFIDVCVCDRIHD